ncbi:MAG: helix-turn-helix transcriptional regulator [Anaerolineae bacterium]|nr:helix-turn-helix transcriptional regulator [Anaerolineae bacterium]
MTQPNSQPASLLLLSAIREAREAHVWTQTELARKMAVSQGTVSFWERGIEMPTLAHLVALAGLMPELFEHLAKHENELLARVYHLERELNNGKCRCVGCGCGG